jgi:hypothetical protein
MKRILLAALGIMSFTAAATAGPRVGVYVNLGGGGFGGCEPRYYRPATPCYAPRVAFCRPPVVYYRPTPRYCYATAPVVYAPIYRAPIIRTGVTVNTVSFGWRR